MTIRCKVSVEDKVPHLIGTYILSIDAFIEDAKARNYTFLQLLKEGFKEEKAGTENDAEKRASE